MKVKELIEALQKFNPEKRVAFAQANGDVNMWCYSAAVELAIGYEDDDPSQDVNIITIQEW